MPASFATISPNANWTAIPAHMHGGISRWVEQGTPPGHFLTAVLKNDLRAAVEHGDEANAAALSAWVRFLFNYCPAGCWGSPERVEHWASEVHAYFEAEADSPTKIA